MTTNLENLATSAEDESPVDLAAVWEAAGSREFRVVDEEGVNVFGAAVRRLTRDRWLYVDDQDGYSVLKEDELSELLLVPEELHTPLGRDREGNVLPL